MVSEVTTGWLVVPPALAAEVTAVLVTTNTTVTVRTAATKRIVRRLISSLYPHDLPRYPSGSAHPYRPRHP